MYVIRPEEASWMDEGAGSGVNGEQRTANGERRTANAER
jgi:hypothetical protein